MCEFGGLGREREGVDVSDAAVEGRVPFYAGDGVAFETFLVEEKVDDFVYSRTERVSFTCFFLKGGSAVRGGIGGHTVSP